MTNIDIEILSEIKKIRSELIYMRSEIDDIKKDTTKMNNHINFIDSVYARIKTPFHYIMDTVSSSKRLE